MNRLHGQGGVSGISLFECALEQVRTELEICDFRCEMRFFVQRSGELSGSGLPAGLHRREAWKTDRSDVCLPSSIPHLLGHCFGANATPGGTAPFCFPDSSPRASLGPCSRKHGLALGSRAHLHSFAKV